VSELMVVIAAGLTLAALHAGYTRWRLSRWWRVRATVVESDVVGPFGLGAAHIARAWTTRGDRVSGPEVVCHVRLLYFANGVPHVAELTFDGPIEGELELRVDPARPERYEYELPPLERPLVLGAIAAALFLLAGR
jgi:hypothetical protein